MVVEALYSVFRHQDGSITSTMGGLIRLVNLTNKPMSQFYYSCVGDFSVINLFGVIKFTK